MVRCTIVFVGVQPVLMQVALFDERDCPAQVCARAGERRAALSGTDYDGVAFHRALSLMRLGWF
jgi:hypothetical protein